MGTEAQLSLGESEVIHGFSAAWDGQHPESPIGQRLAVL